MGKYDFFIADGNDDQYRYRRSGPDRLITRNDRIPDIYEGEYEDDDEEVKYCPHCLEFGMQNKLGHRRLKEGQPPFPEDDMEHFLECYVCGTVFNVYQQQGTEELKEFTETTENPYDSGFHLESVSKRTSPTGQKRMEKRKRERDRPHHKDKEIDEEMRKHGDRVKVVYDTNP